MKDTLGKTVECRLRDELRRVCAENEQLRGAIEANEVNTRRQLEALGLAERFPSLTHLADDMGEALVGAERDLACACAFDVGDVCLLGSSDGEWYALPVSGGEPVHLGPYGRTAESAQAALARARQIVPKALEAGSIRLARARPTAADLVGSDPDFTGGLDSVEYVRRMRGGSRAD